MSERTKLLKKAVLTGVGASTSADRIKSALNEAMQDLVKVGQDLLEDLESQGKVKAEQVQNFLRSLQEEAARRTGEMERKVSTGVQSNLKKAARDLGLVMREELDEVLERLNSLEEAISGSDEEVKKGRRRKSATAQPE